MKIKQVQIIAGSFVEFNEKLRGAPYGASPSSVELEHNADTARE